MCVITWAPLQTKSSIRLLFTTVFLVPNEMPEIENILSKSILVFLWEDYIKEIHRVNMFRVDKGVIDLHLLWGNWGKLFKTGGIGNEP